MGGDIFKFQHTPKMPEAVHIEVAKNLVALLRTKYDSVVVVPCLPGKLSHEDLTIHVGGPVGDEVLTAMDLSKVTDAIEMKISTDQDNRVWVHVAVPWPCHLKSCMPKPQGPFKTREECNAGTTQPTDYSDAVQVNIQQHMTSGDAEWAAYWNSYGDLRLVLDGILSQYGIHHQRQPQDQFNGLVLRPQFIEDTIHKGLYHPTNGLKSHDVFLTNDPEAVLQFCDMRSKIQETEKWFEMRFDTPRTLATWIYQRNRFIDGRLAPEYTDAYFKEIRRANGRQQEHYFFKYFINEYVLERRSTRVSYAFYTDVEPEFLKRSEVESMARRFFDGAGDAVDTEIRKAKAIFEPKAFWRACRVELSKCLREDVIEALNDQRCTGIIGTLRCLWKCLTGTSADLKTKCLCRQDEPKVQSLVNKKYNLVMGCVKNRTVRWHSYLFMPDTPTPVEYELWKRGDFATLFDLIVTHRHHLEKYQAEDSKNLYAKYLELMKIYGRLPNQPERAEKRPAGPLLVPIEN